MLKTNKITAISELKELYKVRYRTFVLEEKDAPANLYKDGLLKDDIDDEAIQIGCFDKGVLVGFLTFLMKKNIISLPSEKQHNIVAEKNSAEIMRLIIDHEHVSENDVLERGQILKQLFMKVSELSKINKIHHLYLVSTSNAKSIYNRLGFVQIGPYRLYKNISSECPMKLNIDESFFMSRFRTAKC